MLSTIPEYINDLFAPQDIYIKYTSDTTAMLFIRYVNSIKKNCQKTRSNYTYCETKYIMIWTF